MSEAHSIQDSTAAVGNTSGCALPSLPTTRKTRHVSRDSVGRPPARLERGDPSPGFSPTGGRSAGAILPGEASQPATLLARQRAATARPATPRVRLNAPSANSRHPCLRVAVRADLPWYPSAQRKRFGHGGGLFGFSQRVRAPSFPGCVSRFRRDYSLRHPELSCSRLSPRESADPYCIGLPSFHPCAR